MKKLLSVFLCLLMVLQLTACGSDKDAASASDSNGSSDAAVQDGNTDPATTETNSGTVLNKAVKVKVGYAYDSSFVYEGDESVDNNSWTQLYKENGIELEILFNVDSSQRDEQLSQAIMAGDYPDFLSVTNTYYLDWANQGIFNDLSEAYEQYASEETKAYYASEEGQRALQSAMIDGKLYGIPTITNPYDSMDILWIRKDWLDNLGLEIPTTVDEFYAVAKAFTENDPDGNGVKDTYGLVLNGKEVFSNVGGLNGVFEMFQAVPGIPNGSVPFVEDEKGNAVFGGSNETEMVEALSLLQDMYDNGFVSKDFVTAGSDQVNEELGSCKGGMAFGAMWMMGTAWKNALTYDENAEFIAIAVPGLDESSIGTSYYTSIPGSFYCMSSQFEDYETFFKIVNLGMYYLARPDDLSQEDYEKYNGLKGTYTGWQCAQAPFGVPLKNLTALSRHQNALATGDISELNAENLRDHNAMMAYIDYKDRRSELTEDELAAFEGGLFFWSVWGAEQCGYKALSDMIEYNHFIYSAYEMTPTNLMSEKATTLNTLTKEFVIEVIMGAKSTDAFLTFLETWRSLGGSEVEVEANTWFQATK